MENEKQREFVKLRAGGLSYSKIAEKIGITKCTLIGWSKKLRSEINNLQQIEYEALREEYLLSRRQRIRVLGTQLQMVIAEIMKRDLSEVPTWRLFKIQDRLVRELAEENEDMTFESEIARTGPEAMGEMLKKRVKWRG